MVAAIALIGWTLLEPPRFWGDAWDYYYQAEAVFRTGSPACQISVGQALQEQAVAWEYDGFDLRVQPRMRLAVETGQFDAFGYFRAANGSYYSWHPPLYGYLALPARWLLEVVGANPFRALPLTNALAVVVALAVIYLSRGPWSSAERHAAALLLLLCGTTYYLWWPHPEATLAPLAYVGLFWWSGQRFGRAALLLGLAANHFPPYAFLLPPLFAHLLWTDWRGRSPGRFPDFRHGLRWAAVVAAGSLCLLAPLYYHQRYGSFSLLAKVGAIHADLASWDRFFSVWFDLNQGALLGLAGVMIGAAVVGFLALGEVWRGRRWEAFGALALLACTAVMTIPCTTQGNWNAGSAIYLRYGYWLSVPLIWSLLLGWRLMAERRRWLLLAPVVAGQLLLVLHHEVFATRYSPVKFTGLSKQVWRAHPAWYNPIPEIFAERLLGWEPALQEGRVFAWATGPSEFRKILYQPTDFRPVRAGDAVVDPTGPVYLALVDPVRQDTEGWTYLNGRFAPAIRARQEIGADCSWVEWTGWSGVETAPSARPWRWNNQATVSLRFYLLADAESRVGQLELAGRALGEQPVEILLADEPIWQGTLRDHFQLVLPVPTERLAGLQPVLLTLRLPEARTHPELSDPRPLALSLERMVWR